MRTLLIDGDILIYKIASQNEEPELIGETGYGLYIVTKRFVKQKSINKYKNY